MMRRSTRSSAKNPDRVEWSFKLRSKVASALKLIKQKIRNKK
jgi:hypothetical protein